MQTASRKFLRLIYPAVFFACAGSDANGVHNPGQPASIDVVPNPATVPANRTVQLQGVVRDASGAILQGVGLTWSTSAPGIATVSSSGLVNGVAPGTAKIAAASASLSDSTTLTVTAALPPGSLRIVASALMGGMDDEMFRDAAVDSHGNIVLVGNSKSANFPTTPGSYDPSYNASGSYLSDAVVVKLSPTGAVLWSTFVGGPNYERAYAMEIDPQDNIIIAGRAGAGLPVTPGALQTTFGGGPVQPTYGPQDGFICKLNPTGTQLIFCTYLGVSDFGFLRDVAVDGSGDIYVAEGTSAGGFPSSWFANAPQKNINGGTDLMVAKIAGDGSHVIWATYLGGVGDEALNPSIRVDAAKNVYIYDPTTSPDLTVTAGGRPYTAGSDIYVAKINPSGTALVYGTYLGGNGNEDAETHGLEVTPGGEAYATGFTTSTNYPTTQGAFQTGPGASPNTQGDMFVSHLSTSGVLLHSTYYGGTGGEMGEGIVTDGQGNVYVSGFTNSAAAQVPQTLSLGPLGLADLLLIQFDPQLGQRQFSARVGGPGADFGRGVAVTPQGEIWVGGVTGAAGWPTVNSPQVQFGGPPNDAVFVRIGP